MLRNAKWLVIACSAALLAQACAAETGADKGAGEPESPAVTGDLGSADHGGAYHGYLEYGVLEDNRLTYRSPYHLWAFEGSAGDELFIDLASRAGDDMVVMLYVESDTYGWDFVAWNDDCYAGTLNSCLEVTLERDRDYLVLVTTYSYAYYRRPAAADYHLTVTCNSCGTTGGGGAGVGELCGGIAGILCAEGLACDYSGNGFCGADLAGVCIANEPRACTREYAPVCGCDGVTYSNDCQRRVALVPLDHAGACGSDGQGEGETCGGIAALRCATGLVCDYSGNDWSGPGLICPADEGGVCAHERSLLCTAEYNPVCGCDGVTYSNDCQRQNAYASLAYRGECR